MYRVVLLVGLAVGANVFLHHAQLGGGHAEADREAYLAQLSGQDDAVPARIRAEHRRREDAALMVDGAVVLVGVGLFAPELAGLARRVKEAR